MLALTLGSVLLCGVAMLTAMGSMVPAARGGIADVDSVQGAWGKGFAVALVFSVLFLCVQLVGLIEGFIYLSKSDSEFVATYLEGRRPWF